MRLADLLARIRQALRPAAVYAALVVAIILGTEGPHPGMGWDAVASDLILLSVVIAVPTVAYSISPTRGSLIVWGLTVVRLVGLILWVAGSFRVIFLREGIYLLDMFVRWTVLASPIVAVALMEGRRRGRGEWLMVTGLIGSWGILFAVSWPFRDFAMDVGPPVGLRYELLGAFGWLAVLVWPPVLGAWLVFDGRRELA
jgi:hypothetical protein